MTRYWDGQYWNNETMTASQREYLMVANPRIYHELFFPDNMLFNPKSSKFAIYHICFDEASEKRMDVNFIEYRKGDTLSYENDAIVDIHDNRTEWKDKRYVGVLSWRFGEKTTLNGSQVVDVLSKSRTDVVSFMPIGHEVYDHPFSRMGFESVRKMVEMVDDAKVLPFTLKDYPIKQNVWCNYWATRPELFTIYVEKYLKPVMSVVGGNTTMYEQHRGRPYLAQCFMLEGLFSVFMQEERLTYKVI